MSLQENFRLRINMQVTKIRTGTSSYNSIYKTSNHITLAYTNSFKFFMSSRLPTSSLCHSHILSLKSMSTSDLSSNRRPSQSEVEQNAIISLSDNVHPTHATFHDSNPIKALCVLPSASSLFRGAQMAQAQQKPWL